MNKKITLTEFKNIVSSFNHEVEYETGDSFLDNENHVCVVGCASITSTYQDMTITYNEGFSYLQNQPTSFTSGTQGLDTVYESTGFIVLDDRGEDPDETDVLDVYDLIELGVLTPDFTEINHNNFISEIQDVDTIGTLKEGAEVFEIERDYDTTLKFNGELVASAESSPENAHPRYSGSVGDWEEVSIYKIDPTTYAVGVVYRTQWVNGETKYSGSVGKWEEVVKFLESSVKLELWEELRGDLPEEMNIDIDYV